jgi:hypothetical protein
MKTKHIYLILGFFGVVLPYSQFLPWNADNGLNIPFIIEQISTSSIAVFGWLDVIVSAFVHFVFIFTDGRERKVSNLWMPNHAMEWAGDSQQELEPSPWQEDREGLKKKVV